MESDDLSGSNIQGNPNPLFVIFVADEAPEFVDLDIQGIQSDLVLTAARGTKVQVFRQLSKQFGEVGHQPSEADRKDAANPTQRISFQQSSADQAFNRFWDHFLLVVQNKLATTALASVILFAVVDVTVFLTAGRGAGGAIDRIHDVGGISNRLILPQTGLKQLAEILKPYSITGFTPPFFHRNTQTIIHPIPS